MPPGRVAYKTPISPILLDKTPEFDGFATSGTVRSLSPVSTYFGPPLRKGHKFKLRFRPSEGCLKSPFMYMSHLEPVVVFFCKCWMKSGWRTRSWATDPFSYESVKHKASPKHVILRPQTPATDATYNHVLSEELPPRWYDVIQTRKHICLYSRWVFYSDWKPRRHAAYDSVLRNEYNNSEIKLILVVL